MEVGERKERFLKQRQVLIFFVFLGITQAGSEPRHYSVAEETESGSFVANLLKDLGLEIDDLAARAPRVISKGKKMRLHFDRQTGDLLLNEKLDREELCGPIEPCVLPFQMLLENPLQFFQAEIRIRDINDHSPVFLDKEIVLKISESITPGTTFLIERAQDLDVGSNSLQSYTVSPNSHFHLKLQESPSGTVLPQLVLNKALDREEQPEIRLILTALDGGTPPRSGTTIVRIEVLDINDNAPEFAKLLYEVQVLENSPIGYQVAIVTARDLDTGAYGEISYVFSQASEDIRKTFRINEKSGELLLTQELDFESIQNYTLNIQATDGGGLSGSCVVFVQVMDLNDNPPELTMSTLINEIPENLQETIIAVFSVSDPDSGDNGRMVCSIQDDLPFILKPSVENFYTLVTNRALDRETRSEYNITITVTDMGTPSSRRYSVAEEKERGFLIANLAKDLGLSAEELAARGAQIVSKGNKHHFQLNHQTGDLLLLETLDREELCGPTEPCVLHFQILLQNPLLFITNELQVIDVNDHSPVFSENEMQLKILENTPPGTIIPLENAEDLDVGKNSLQNYTITPNSHFHVLTRSRRDKRKYPELVLDKVLDREEQPELTLTLTALDGGTPPRSGTVQIHILVLDINDNAPEFTQSLYEVQILENSPLNSVIVTVSASDLDTGIFGTISYAFFHASEEIRKTFQLNSITGDIQLTKYLNFEAINTYEVDVEAKDGGGLSGKSTVIVQVVDVNDNPPELSLSSITSPIPENSPETVVAIFSVSDLDSGDNGRMICSIENDLPFGAARAGRCSVPEGPFPGHLVDVSGTGTLSHSYQYQVCVTGDHRAGEFKFLKPIFPNLLVQDTEREIKESSNCRNSFVFS
nr:protocadherin beta-2 [Vicugna pacos]